MTQGGVLEAEKEKLMIQLALTCAAVIFGAVKIVATIWLARQPDAILVTNTRFGRSTYLISKITPTLFVASMLALGWIRGAPLAYLIFCTIALVASIFMAIIVVRQRDAGKWYGYMHEIRQQRERRNRSDRRPNK